MNYGIIVYILGWVMSLESMLMLAPCACALVYQEKRAGFSFLLVALAFLALGMLIVHKKPKNQQFFTKEGFTTVGLSWIIISVIGALPMYVCREIPSFVDALFETVSGFTTTGSTICTDVEVLSRSVNLWRCLTHWIGGMGVLVFLLAVVPMAGGNSSSLMRAESPGPSVGKLVPKMKDSSKILYCLYFGLTVLCFISLIIAKMPLYDAICTSIGTAGTGGFGIKGDSIAGYSHAIQWIITVFMILFGVNFNFYFFLILGKNKLNAFKIEEVMWYFIIIFASIGLITWNIHDMYSSNGNALRDASFSVGAVITTTGFATADFNLWPSLSKMILVSIMFVGACAGSTGGGMKVSRFIIMFRVVKQEVYSFVHPRSVKTIRMDGKTIDNNVVTSVMKFVLAYIFIFVGSLFIISLNGFDIVTNFTSVTATMNNIGPGLEMVGPTGNFAHFSVLSKFVFMFDMLAGRLELFPILILFSPALWKKK